MHVRMQVRMFIYFTAEGNEKTQNHIRIYCFTSFERGVNFVTSSTLCKQQNQLLLIGSIFDVQHDGTASTKVSKSSRTIQRARCLQVEQIARRNRAKIEYR